jgi:hypothetical protein
MGRRLGRVVTLATACAVLLALGGFAERAGAAGFGANDETPLFLADQGALYFRQMAAIGLQQTVITVRFTPSVPSQIEGSNRLDAVVRNATAAGLRVVFAVYPYPPREVQAGVGSPAAFAAWLTAVARRYPAVKQFTVMNEPNQTAFLRPQFGAGRRNTSAATAGVYLAAAYDALKAVDPAIAVIGVGLSPRGNDDARAPSNVSTSPVRFLEALGRWYRASGRTLPLMDGFSFHPYPVKATDPLAKPYVWPNAGFANLDRVKQALWDAFDGTAQPTTVNGLKLYLDEVGWQVDTHGLPGYTGKENVPVTDDAGQAAVYSQLVHAVACDPDIAEANFFGFYDDRRRTGFQAGLYHSDGTARMSAAAVQTAISETTLLGCSAIRTAWSPASGVVGAGVQPQGRSTAAGAIVAGVPTTLSVSVSVAEGARITAVVRGASGAGSALARLLSVGDESDLGAAATMIPFGRGTLAIALPNGLGSGSYDLIVRFVAEANERRTTVVETRVVVRRSS